MKSSYPVKLLVDNATLPSRELVLERFKASLEAKSAEREARERAAKGG